ncbi:FixH family protein [Bacillus sp. USDA818B3_A]|uniref:FixH family protein n=1 Tax=Bacillus sp. USDA818B3_A TaxID=2698834 RepID=UPI001F2237DE|nr:FixH family protein [Bacillus sp. USDA818B3_A]
MKKLGLMLIVFLLFSLAVSCSKQEENSGEIPEMVEVNLTVNPNPGEPNKPITFEAEVTQGKEKVDDADVSFEVWRSKDEHHEKISVKHTENGIYRLEKTFKQEGTYYVISHVTARDMHNMPKKEFTVGTPSEKEEDSTSGHSMDGMDMDDHENHNQ